MEALAEAVVEAEAPTDAGPACPSHCQVFTCSVCQETFRRRMELRLHMVSHTGEMPYKVRFGLSPGLGASRLALYLGWCWGASPSPAVEEPCPPFPCPRVPCPVLPHLWAGLLFLSAEGSLSLGMGVAPEALPSVAFTPGREHLGLCPALGFPSWQPGGLRRPRPVFQCASCSQQFMQKKDLQSHMIKLHGAPKPHAVSARPS